MAEADILPPQGVELLDGEVMYVGSNAKKYRFTADEFDRMAEAGVFDPDSRVELLDGEIVELRPIGTRHAGGVNRLTAYFTAGLGPRAVVAVQNPIRVGDFSQPQPDLVLLRPRPDFYAERRPLPTDVLLAVEVADTSLRFDLRRKAPLYVAGGLPEVWVIDLRAKILHVFRSGTQLELRAGESVSPEAFPEFVLEVAAVLGLPR